MGPTAPRVAVTGAGGFIGRRLCERLAGDGFPVRGLDRDPEVAEPVEATGAAFRVLDVTDADATRAALRGSALAVHTAALVSDRGTMDEFVRVNVGGTRAVLDGAAAAGVERVSTSPRWRSGALTSRPI